MDATLELARTKLTVRYLAEHSSLAEAESLLRSIRETTTYLERRIAREKQSAIISEQFSVPLGVGLANR